MSEREHFLRRWSRRKREAARPAVESDVAGAEVDASRLDSIENAAVSPPGKNAPEGEASKPEEGFDPKTLPSIDAITAATDMRPFLMPGVPEELRRAALRRAWQADPAIRDFVGLSENSWDFNNPEGVHGFGPLEMTEELKKIVERTLAPRGQPNEPSPDAESPDAEKPALPQSVQLAATQGPAVLNKEEPGANPAGHASIPREAREKNFLPDSGDAARQKHVAPRREAAADPKSFRNPKAGRGGALPK